MRLELREVTRSFGGLTAVNRVSLAAESGRITGLIGPNGAGKTTVINLITGMLKLSSGSVLLDERDISYEPPHQVARLGIARTFQNIRLLKEATALDNVAVGLSIRDRTGFGAQLLGTPSALRFRSESRTVAQGLLRDLGIEFLAPCLAGGLAYGHQRRVEIARALALGGSVLLLDEPVAGMNDVEAAELGEIITRCASRGMAVLLVEHNMDFVMSLCDDIYVLSAGELIAHGTPASVQTNQLVIDAYLGTA